MIDEDKGDCLGLFLGRRCDTKACLDHIRFHLSDSELGSSRRALDLNAFA